MNVGQAREGRGCGSSRGGSDRRAAPLVTSQVPGASKERLLLPRGRAQRAAPEGASVAPNAGSSVVYPPTSSWAGTGTSGTTGDEYSVGGGVQRPLHYPGSRSGYTYTSSSSISSSGGYSQQGEGSTGPRVTDYEMGEPRGRYHQYYPDPDQAAAAAPVVPRRYQDRIWWPPVPLPVLGTRTDSYLPRSISPDAPQQAHQGLPKRQMERSLGRGETEGSGRGQHGAGGDRHLPHDTHIINIVRGVPVQDGTLGQEYHEAWPPPPSTTPTPDPRTRHNNTPYNSPANTRSRENSGYNPPDDLQNRQTSGFDSASNLVRRQSSGLDTPLDPQSKESDGFDSLLQMMTMGEQKAGSITIEAPDRRGGTRKRAKSGTGKNDDDKTPVLARVEPSTRPSTPVTPTILLGSIMLLIILVV
ncbi:hypothetical protein Pcinc_039369, partial [Petrolisthes cinctipes]